MEGGALASPDVEEEFLWSCSLSGAGKVKAGPPCSVSFVVSFHQMFVWDPKECEDSARNKGAVPSHRLLARGHRLLAQYKVDIVEVENEGYNKTQVRDLFEILCALNSLRTWQVTLPVVAMKGSVDAPSAPAAFRLVSGARPLHLVGSHCVTHYVEAEDKELVLFSNYDPQQVVDNLLFRFVACHMCNTPSSLCPGSRLQPTKPSEGKEGADTTK